MLLEQQEGAEQLVRALRQELHSLRQDTNSVAANARQTVSEKEALQVNPCCGWSPHCDWSEPPCAHADAACVLALIKQW